MVTAPRQLDATKLTRELLLSSADGTSSDKGVSHTEMGGTRRRAPPSSSSIHFLTGKEGRKEGREKECWPLATRIFPRRGTVPRYGTLLRNSTRGGRCSDAC
jgi:hypothetical protein